MRATVETVASYVRSYGTKLPDPLIYEHAREMASAIYRSHGWDFRVTEGQITAVADYTTGTVSVTQGQTAVTFSGSTLTAAMATRHFQAGATDGTAGRWYTFYSINTVAGTAVLNQPYEGDTDATATFCIRQRYYRLPPDFDQMVVGKESGGMKVVWVDDRRNFESRWSTISASGSVWYLVPAGASTTPLYNTGTFAVNNGSATVTITTGVVSQARDLGRRFRPLMFPKVGDFTIVQVSEGGNTYTLDRAWPELTVSGQGLYQVDPAGERLIEPYPSPAEGNSSVMFYYYRVPPVLFSQADTPNWSPDLDEIWKQATLLRCYAPKPSDFQIEFDLLMQAYMKKQGYQDNQIIPSGKWGFGNQRPGSNLPWNFPATSFWR